MEVDCIYNDADEDCNKCVKKGYVANCAGCDCYTDFFGNKRKVEDDELSERG